MITPGQNTGVIINPPRETDLHVGSIVPSITNKSADWRQYECDGEWQKDMTIDFETDACMSFASTNTIATYLNWLIDSQQIQSAQLAFLKGNGYIGADGKVAISPRFTATMDGTTVNGNDFQHPWDSIQNDGLVPDSAWPMPVDAMNADPANAWHIYYAQPTDAVKALGKQFLQYFKINWHWLVSNGQGASQSQFAQWLQNAPIHIAIAVCSPWNTAEPINGCGVGASHGVQLSHVEVGVVNNILDHYAPFQKQLAADYTLSYAVQGWAEQIPQPAQKTPLQTVQDALPQVQQALATINTAPNKTAELGIIEQILLKLEQLLGIHM
jgi:hypothetical protein